MAIALYSFWGSRKETRPGEDSQRPFHVYSSPQNPEICPVLALAAYLVAYSDVVDGLLCPGTSQYSRFMDSFHKTIDDHENEFKELGVKKGDLGSHSARKGAVTLLTTGRTVVPPMASVCSIRAGWSIGPAKD